MTRINRLYNGGQACDVVIKVFTCIGTESETCLQRCLRPLGLVSISRQMPRPQQIDKAIIRLSSHPSRKSLCFDSNLVVVVVVIGLMETRLKTWSSYCRKDRLRPCPKEHITALQVSIAKISCERLLLSKTCLTNVKSCLLSLVSIYFNKL